MERNASWSFIQFRINLRKGYPALREYGLINLILIIHVPMDLGGLSEVGAGFFEGGAIGELGAGGVHFLGGGKEK